jgi:hypothetical protein
MNKGIQKWSGLFDLALESGHITNAKKGWYQIVDMTTGEVEEKSYRSKELENNDEFFKKLSADPTFREFIETRFKLTAKGTDIDDGSDEDIDSDDDE